MYKNKDYFCELSLEGTAKDSVRPESWILEKVLLFAQQFQLAQKKLVNRYS